jgi:hypothetical protein
MIIDQSKNTEDLAFQDIKTKIKVITFGGELKGSAHITPREVIPYKEINPIKGPHWLYYKKCASALENLTGVDYDNGQNIYRSDVRFPPICVVCSSNEVHFDFFEESTIVNPANRVQISIPKESSITHEEAFHAWQNKRIWVAIPFCKDHSIKDKKIYLQLASNEGGRSTMGTTNYSFGNSFGAVNNIKGIWVVPIAVGIVKFNTPEEYEEKLKKDKHYIKKVLLLRLLLGAISYSPVFLSIPFIVKLTQNQNNPDILTFVLVMIFGILLSPLLFFVNKVGNFPKK